MDKRADAWITK